MRLVVSAAYVLPSAPSRNIALTFSIICVLLMTITTCHGQASQSGDAQAETALTLEKEGKSAEAEKAWHESLKLHPDSADAYAHLGFLAARRQDYPEAIPLYRKALVLEPSMPGLEMNLGLALFKAGDLKEAVSIFQTLLKHQHTGSADAQRLSTLIGVADYGLKDYADAVPFLKKTTASDPKNLPFRLFLAQSCLASRQYRCVLDVYHEILMLNAESAEADMLAGEALDETQDHAGAIQQFRAAVKANPKEPNVHFGLGYLLWTQGQLPEAAQEFRAELENVPDNTQALMYLADANIKMNHPETAVPLIKKALQLDPNAELAHLDLGIVYSEAGRQNEALRELQRAATLSPTNVTVHWRLARLYEAMGRKAEAQAEISKTKTLTKAADESLRRKLESSRANESTTPQPSGADPSNQ